MSHVFFHVPPNMHVFTCGLDVCLSLFFPFSSIFRLSFEEYLFALLLMMCLWLRVDADEGRCP